MSALEELYKVENGVDDVNDADHNTLVDAANYLAGQLRSGIGGAYGSGADGNLLLGAITNPTAGNVATASDITQAGDLSGSFTYKYSLYNLSGETLPTNASAAMVVSAKRILLALPAQAAATNITGFRIYRSNDASNYYKIADVPVDDPTSANLFEDNIQVATTATPSGSNTTSASVTTQGIYQGKRLIVKPGQSISVTAGTKVGLIFLCTDYADVQSGASISSQGMGSVTKSPLAYPGASSSNSNLTTDGFLSANGATNISGGAIPVEQLLSGNTCFFNQSGFGGSGTGTPSVNSKPGAPIVIIAKNFIRATGTFTSSATAASGTEGGSAGGLIYFYSPIVDRTSGTFTANGANGSTFGGGGGGGIIIFAADYIIGSGTSTANAGTGIGTSTGYTAGGGFGGKGGDTPVGSSGPALNGTAGQILSVTARATIPLSFV